MSKQPRKVCFVITSFIHYSRNFLILDELEKRDDVELHIVVGGTALVPRHASKYADIFSFLEADGHTNVHRAYFNLEGDSAVVKAKTAGIGVSEFANVFNIIQPDIVVVRADRFEVLSAAIAAAYMHITVAHIEGGDVSGTLDESVRHAITKMSHLHFTTNDAARERVLRMGEHPDTVFNFGSPDVEVAEMVDERITIDLTKTGSGLKDIDLTEPFLEVMFHPVTTEVDQLADQTRVLLEAVHTIALPTLWFWPNADSGAEIIAGVLREFNDQVHRHNIKFVRYLPPRTFLSILRRTSCLIGNSSAGLKECSVLGVPVVNVGSRQCNRTKTENVTDAPFVLDSLTDAINAQVTHGRYESSQVYHSESTAKRISYCIATTKLYTQKTFHE